MTTQWQDLRNGVGMLPSRSRFALVAVLTLTLGMPLFSSWSSMMAAQTGLAGAYINGLWFDGARFRRMNFYVVNIPLVNISQEKIGRNALLSPRTPVRRADGLYYADRQITSRDAGYAGARPANLAAKGPHVVGPSTDRQIVMLRPGTSLSEQIDYLRHWSKSPAIPFVEIVPTPRCGQPPRGLVTNGITTYCDVMAQAVTTLGVEWSGGDGLFHRVISTSLLESQGVRTA